jgi:hypothetical protein
VNFSPNNTSLVSRVLSDPCWGVLSPHAAGCFFTRDGLKFDPHVDVSRVEKFGVDFRPSGSPGVLRDRFWGMLFLSTTDHLSDQDGFNLCLKS